MSAPARALDVLARTVAPLVLAILGSAVVLLALGANPWAFYADVLRFSLTGEGWQQTLTAMAPLLLISLGLIVSFRAQLWNLGYGGTYLLSAAVVAGVAPAVFAFLPYGAATLLLLVLAAGVGLILALIPASLKAWFGTNEVITSLMTSFVAASLANLLVKGPFQDPSVSVPQTRVLDLEFMLAYVPGTRVHLGVVLAFALVILMHVMLTRSSFGTRIDVLGLNPRAAAHAGIHVPRMTVAVFVVSGALIGLAGAIDMLGLWGYMRTDWNPGYGDKILPFVFLARLNPLGSVPLVGVYAVLATGGTLAAQRAGISVDLLTLLVALVLFFMVIVEYLAARHSVGRSYLPRGIFKAVRA